MRRSRRFAVCLSMLATAVALTAAPFSVSAQGVPVAEAETFIGNWELPLATDMGPFEMTIDITNADGQVAAAVGSPQGAQAVEDISKSGEDLVLTYSMDAQGQSIPVMLTLRPDSDDLAVTVDAAGGMFVASGTATRADG